MIINLTICYILLIGPMNQREKTTIIISQTKCTTTMYKGIWAYDSNVTFYFNLMGFFIDSYNLYLPFPISPNITTSIITFTNLQLQRFTVLFDIKVIILLELNTYKTTIENKL